MINSKLQLIKHVKFEKVGTLFVFKVCLFGLNNFLTYP